MRRKLGVIRVNVPSNGDAEITLSVPVDGIRDLFERSKLMHHPTVLIEKDFIRRVIGRAVENIRQVTHSLDNETHPAIEYRIED